MLISIVDINHKDQRYDTVGDWNWDKRGNLLITISDMGDWRYNFLVALHELCEVMLCRHRSIPQSEVDQFDMAFEARREEGNVDEPGDDLLAPYHAEHVFATKIEKQMAKELNVDWEEYDKTVGSL